MNVFLLKFVFTEVYVSRKLENIRGVRVFRKEKLNPFNGFIDKLFQTNKLIFDKKLNIFDVKIVTRFSNF